MTQKMFVAGASGLIGQALCKILLEKGFEVYGTTRTAAKAEILTKMGVKSVIVDVFDAETLTQQMLSIRPDVVFHELTDLPDGLAADQMEASLARNARIRDEGTRNLVSAAKAAGVKKIIAQSITLVYEPSENLPFTEESPLLNFADPVYGETSKGVYSLEQQITKDEAFVGVVLRYGWLYGEGTGFDAAVDFAPSVHKDAAAHAAVLALNATESAIFNAADDDARLSSEKIKRALGWKSDFRL
ncbi:NAD-dependent epimerase/dehydratase family protein [Rodentibacter trehalosifermentans]|uniref:NAD-dependent epimerase/dehydratase domain-containing protein n=1 Tax=Rodentibacter trehalosifermentans TaxID=1908263 RepID=A0A1V3INJ6_9PAST|nr:NAD(P)-dependent oxidoreductase [Rodentibacter trehalosifermentans]OOF43696.1 hypothetical protein BKK51_11090 [Rodentibacter trehalosifermentans]OOF49756.1 hypothetical protein BKK52_02785 [Rodentibacter trehalosifermentans]OOF51636.1 hypothetical protein BKK53_07035 [Rodentibacter trehalosifermentans]